MKGSPMQRNFGIGSPLHQENKKALTDAEIKKGDHLLNSIDPKIAEEKRYDLMHNAQNLEDDKGVTPEISRESFERNFNLNTQAASDTTGAYMHQVLQGENESPIPMKASPNKTRVGRWLMGRKKHTADDGTEVITDKRENVVKTKSSRGVKTKYKKGNRPSSYNSTSASRIQHVSDNMFENYND